jgi:PTH1 family peptidyl-tRNA hydrolase
VWIVAGLGNPGTKYERNRHNVGFRVVDELARRHNLGAWKGGKLGGDTTTGMITTPRGRQKALLLKPMEFMNLSGFAVQRAAQFHGVEIDQIVVVHDELDLDFGKLRLKAGGGHGGHNGLRSMIEQLGKPDFLRVRVGIGKPGPTPGKADGGFGGPGAPAAAAAGKDRAVVGWVLADFPSHQATALEQVIGLAADGVEAILGKGIGPAMNEFNAREIAV